MSTGRAVILVLMYVKIFKTSVIIFISDVKMCFSISVSSCACELRTDLIFLWIKVSSVIQTLSAAHIKGKLSNLQINTGSQQQQKSASLVFLKHHYFTIIPDIFNNITIPVFYLDQNCSGSNFYPNKFQVLVHLQLHNESQQIVLLLLWYLQEQLEIWVEL